MTYKIITPPTEEPITLAQVKANCRIDGVDFDAMISEIFIPSARESAEHETKRALCTQTRELVLDSFPEAFELFGSPIASIESIKFIDQNGDNQTLDPVSYLLDKDSSPGYATPAYGYEWPETLCVPNAVRVRYVCGYGTAADVPKGIKSWMLLAVGTMVAQAETMVAGNVNSLPDNFWHRMLDPFKTEQRVI